MALIPESLIYVLIAVLLTYGTESIFTRLLGSLFMGISGARLAVSEQWLDTTTFTIKEISTPLTLGSWNMNTTLGFILIGLALIIFTQTTIDLPSDIREYRQERASRKIKR